MAKFIVLEGLDGSGSLLKVNLLIEYFKARNATYEYLHFPRLDSPIIGEMISKFLRGEFGDVENTNPYFVAMMYSLDRSNTKELINGWLKTNEFILIDRYVYSNIAFQCAKIDDLEKKQILKNWILELEYEFNNIPKPDISMFLHVPFEFVSKTLKNERLGEDRAYLKGSEDIHENDLSLQKKVENEYLTLTTEEDKFKLINCCKDENNVLSASEINKIIIDTLKQNCIL